MPEVYREEGFVLLGLEPGPGCGSLAGFDGLDIVSLYLEKRIEKDVPSLACEVFFPGKERYEGMLAFSEAGTDYELSWSFSFPEKPGDKALAVLLSLAGSLPALHEMQNKEQWAGGCFRIEQDGAWSESLKACGISVAEQKCILELGTSSKVILTLHETSKGISRDTSYSSPFMEEAEIKADGSMICQLNPLALYALLGLDAQFAIEDAAALLEEPNAWTDGLLTFVLGLSEMLPADEAGDEACDEFVAESLANMMAGPMHGDCTPSELRVLEETLPALLGRIDALPGWQVQSFEEIAEQQEGKSPAGRGERIWRLTHTAM